MAVVYVFFESQGMNPFSIELLDNIFMRIWRNLWSLSSTLDGILSGPSDLVGLSVLSLL